MTGCVSSGGCRGAAGEPGLALVAGLSDSEAEPAVPLAAAVRRASRWRRRRGINGLSSPKELSSSITMMPVTRRRRRFRGQPGVAALTGVSRSRNFK